MGTQNFPGQLVISTDQGYDFKHDPGAKGGRVYDGESIIATFIFLDAGEADTPLGTYICVTEDGANNVWVDTYDGASGYLSARKSYASETMYHDGYRFEWDEVGDRAKAITDNPEDDPYGRATGSIVRQLEGFLAYPGSEKVGFRAASLDVAAGYLWGWHTAKGTFDLPEDPDIEPRQLIGFE